MALIETAIVLLLLFLVTFGLLEYGWMFLKMGNITNAARQGARIAARPNATAAQAITAAQNALTQGNIPLASATVTVSPNPIPANYAPGSQITVTVSVKYSGANNNPKIGLGLPFIPKPLNLTSTMVMAREGP